MLYFISLVSFAQTNLNSNDISLLKGIENFTNGKYEIANSYFKIAYGNLQIKRPGKISDWIEKSEKCIDYISKGDEKFNISNYSQAKHYYDQVLCLNPQDKYCLTQIRICNTPLDMVFVHGGTMNMGNNSGLEREKPAHQINITNFYIDKYEVTVAQYRKFCIAKRKKMPEPPPWGWNDNDPMVKTGWQNANDYAQWAGKRLPTEAEWEFAARGGTKSENYIYCGSDIANEVAWFFSNSNGKPHPVGTKKPNELGIYDMSGNVWEYCADFYDKNYYKKSTINNPKGAKKGKYRVLRGGSWSLNEDVLRCSFRSHFNPVYGSNRVGFRCVKD
jgi:tetratricopeptide (TPR) repeat protein